MVKIPLTTLRNGYAIPQVGLGLWQVTDESQFNMAFRAAVKAGYRHFDTAQIYGNEHMLGNAWSTSGLKRNELFITTKISVTNFGAKRSLMSFKKSLKNLKTDYVDLLLLHFPVSIVRKKTWLAIEETVTSGQARSIGVSNYTIRHLEELKQYANIIPAVNQVELHVFLQQPELLAYCHINNIVVEAYSPLAHAKDMNETVISRVAKKHQKTYAQIMLRWCIQNNCVVIPKSVQPHRIIENMSLFDFTLDESDMRQLQLLNRDLRTCWNPTRVP